MTFNFLLLIFLLIPAASQGAAGSFEVSQSRYWKLLLHWRSPIIGSEKSEADGPGFFLSPEGKIDAEKELLEDIKAFEDSTHVGIGPIKQHPQCAFPERYRFLKEQLHLKAEDQPCLDFKKWKSGFNPKSVTLVYAAPFFGSPASMFGHTFLRIDSKPRAGHTDKNDLLDYGISFEADPGPNPGLTYAIKGVLGMYHGLFMQQSYYLKINNYVNMESRDLWEYELKLSDDQMSRLLNHIWEMGITYFNYYFFNKNCSYQLLSLLEVASPEWHLREHFTGMTIPGDTIRVLSKESNAVKKIHLRPALTRVLEQHLSLMSEKDKDDFFNLRNDYAKLTGSESIKTLDALLDWDKFKTMKEQKAIYDPEISVDQRLRIARARAGSKQNETYTDATAEVTEQSVPPEKGHDSSKMTTFGGVENSTSLFGFEYRPVFQDVLDPDEGYLPHSSLIIARARASFISDRLRLDDFTFAEVINLVPLNQLQPKLSWRIGLGLFHPEDVNCVNCLGFSVAGGGGLGFQVTKKPDLFIYSLVNAKGQASNGFTQNYNGPLRYGLSIETGLLLKLSKDLKFLATFEPQYFSGFAGDPLHQWAKLSGGISYAILPFELRLTEDSFFNPIQSYNRFVFNFSRYF